MRMTISREEAQDMDVAHALGYHAEFPREGCPSCEERPLTSYLTEQQIRERQMAAAE